MGGKADLDRGYTRLANTYVEAFARLNLGQHEWRVVWVVIRKTYGWNKKSDHVSMSQISDAADLDRRHASRARRKLIDKRILIEDESGLMLNRDVEQWGVPLEAHPDEQGGCAPGGTVSVPLEAQGCAPGGTVSVPLEAHQQSQTGGKKKTAKRSKRQTSGRKTGTKGGVPPEAPQKTVKTGKDTNGVKTPKDISGGGRKTAPAGNGKTPPPTAAVWAAYSAAYQERYGVEPIRNATVNGQLSNLVKRVGKDLAPMVAAYYVGLDTRFYVQKGHAVGPMLADAEKLATECRTNTRITETSARQADQSSARLSVFQKLLLEEQNRGK